MLYSVAQTSVKSLVGNVEDLSLWKDICKIFEKVSEKQNIEDINYVAVAPSVNIVQMSMLRQQGQSSSCFGLCMRILAQASITCFSPHPSRDTQGKKLCGGGKPMRKWVFGGFFIFLSFQGIRFFCSPLTRFGQKRLFCVCAKKGKQLIHVFVYERFSTWDAVTQEMNVICSFCLLPYCLIKVPVHSMDKTKEFLKVK